MTHTGKPQCMDCKYMEDRQDIRQYGMVSHDYFCLMKKEERVYPMAFPCEKFESVIRLAD